jgi:glycosyltransferase involved in cell wall biosynthesis
MSAAVVASIQKLLSDGHFRDALILCESMTQKAESAELHQLLGYALQQTGQYAKAVTACRRANELGLQDWSNHLILGRSLTAIGDHHSACEAFRHAYKLSPQNFEASEALFVSIYSTEGWEAADAFRSTLSNEAQQQSLVIWKYLNELARIDTIESLVKHRRYDQIAEASGATLSQPISRTMRRYMEYIEHYRRWDEYRSTLKSPVPVLSVLVITYNHERYIGQALESILTQKTQYPIEIIVMEDCSTDGTRDVIIKYVKRYPGRIIPVFNPVNIGTLNPPQQKVTHEGFKRLKGDYIAILEGDDYWSSPHKVQMQIDFLEKNPKFVATSHNTMKIYQDSDKEPHRFLYWENTKSTHDVDDMITYSFFHTSSFIYRNMFQGNPPDFFRSQWSCDIFMNIFFAHHGYIRYFDLDMSVYRAHAGGGYSTMSMLKGAIFNINGLRKYNKWLGYRYTRSFAFQISRRCKLLFQEERSERRPIMSSPVRWKLKAIGLLYSFIFHTLTRFPSLDPAIYWYNEPRS